MSALILTPSASTIRRLVLSRGMDRTGHSPGYITLSVEDMAQILKENQEELKLFDHSKRLALANFLFRANLCSVLLREIVADPVCFKELKMLAETY